MSYTPMSYTAPLHRRHRHRSEENNTLALSIRVRLTPLQSSTVMSEHDCQILWMGGGHEKCEQSVHAIRECVASDPVHIAEHEMWCSVRAPHWLLTSMNGMCAWDVCMGGVHGRCAWGASHWLLSS